MTTVRSPDETKQSLDDKVRQSNHDLSENGDRYTCKLCHSSFRRTDKSFQDWLAGICVPVVFNHSRPSQISSHLHVGNQCIHHSHKLQAFRGFVYCSKCGSRKGSSSIRYLASECRPPSDTGKATLRALSKGKLPPGLDDWPE